MSLMYVSHDASQVGWVREFWTSEHDPDKVTSVEYTLNLCDACSLDRTDCVKLSTFYDHFDYYFFDTNGVQ